MWGTCSNNSDWDLVVVVKQLKSPNPQSIHKGSIDAFILSKEQYNDQLEAHSMQVLLTLWLPEQCILQQMFDPKTVFKFSEMKLVTSLSASRERDLRIAEKHFSKGNPHQAKKVLVHCVRYLDLGIQMKNWPADKLGILNYSSANHYREQVLRDYSSKWEELVVHTVLTELWSNLTSTS